MKLDVNAYRYELKYIINNYSINEYLKLILINANAKKKYDRRIVNSVYFDDINFSNANDNLVGLSLRKKFRLRWYNNSDNLFFETKIKKNRLNFKKILQLSLNDKKINNLTIFDLNEIFQKQVLKKYKIISNYLYPTLGVSYFRDYYENNNGIRITVDNNINFYQTINSKKISEVNYTKYNYSVLEIKFQPDLLNHANKILVNYKTLLSRHSKYLIGLKLLNYINY